MVDHILKVKPTVVITEKGLSDFAAHHLQKAGVTAIRRLRKTDNNRIARACGATIVNRPEDVKESDIGTGASLFKVHKLGEEYWTSVIGCNDPKACTVLLRGASKDILNEVERNLMDAMCVARNIALDSRLVAGGGSIEMAVSHALMQNAAAIEGIEALPYKSAAQALEVIPRTLIGNCGASPVRCDSTLRFHMRWFSCGMLRVSFYHIVLRKRHVLGFFLYDVCGNLLFMMSDCRI
jgi:T-complex protein 1 subunit gamma